MAKVGGVLPSQWIRQAVADGHISACAPLAPGQVQPNSLDLRIGEVGWRVQCSFLPGEEGIHQKLSRFMWYDFPVPEEGVVLERNQIYFFPLCERLALPPAVSGRANPKSTTGRLDVFTRLVTEYGSSFDIVPDGYQGPLFLEVAPRSFAIRVRPGDALAQIRFQQGDPHLTPAEVTHLLDTEDLLLGPNLETLRARDVQSAQGLVLSISLPRRDQRTVGYVARRNTPPIDLRAIGGARKRHYWDWIHGDSKPIILEPDEFYIFASRELVRLPPNICAEMVAFDASSGEVRTHYAGFFDSGFGYSPHLTAGQSAAAVVLEVRSRDVPFLIEDGQSLFRVMLLRCTEQPDIIYGQGLGSNYQSQRLRLSKQFSHTAEPDEDDRVDERQPRLDFAHSE